MKVRIYHPHTHAGETLQPGPEGIELDVSPQDAEFMKDAGVLDRPSPVFAPLTGAKPAPPSSI